MNLRTIRTIFPKTIASADNGAGAGGGAGGGGGAADGAGAGGGGAGDGGGNGGGGSGGGGAAAFYEAFKDEALKTSPSIQRYKTPEELGAAYVNLEKRYGIDPARRIDLPADPNDTEGMKAVYGKLGMPEKPDGYGFELDDKATDADKALTTAFSGKAHELGLSVKQAQGLMSFMGEQVAADVAAVEAAQTARVAAGKEALTKEFGQAFESRTREIRTLVEKYGDPELAAVLKDDGVYAYPNLAKMLSKLVERMAEPGAAGGESGDAAGGARALTPAQARAAVIAIEADPVKGKALRERNHPQHKAVTEERNRLARISEGVTPT